MVAIQEGVTSAVHTHGALQRARIWSECTTRSTTSATARTRTKQQQHQQQQHNNKTNNSNNNTNGYNDKRAAETPWVAWPEASQSSGLGAPRMRTTMP
jgi:hypothetical protein